MKKELIKKLYPFGITLGVVIVDQISKLIITSTMKEGDFIPIIGDFFRITFVRNPNVIFGLGKDLPEFLRPIVIVLLPILGMTLLLIYYFNSREMKYIYRLPFAAILGGGIGNIIDRLFAPGGVVDFLDFDFFDLDILGKQIYRFPTFNLADSAVTVSCLFLLGLFIYDELQERKKEKNQS